MGRGVVVILACILGLETADGATVGAVAHDLKRSLEIGNAQLGLLAAVTPIVGGLMTLPAGVLVDRTRRTRLLTISVALWSAAMAASGAAPSFPFLLVTRLVFGVIIATAFPSIASLMGDLFAPRERARAYSYVLAGEVAGSAVGFLVAGEATSFLSWRFGFWALVVPGLALAAATHRFLPEPGRGTFAADASQPSERDIAAEKVAEEGVDADPAAVLDGDPARLSLPRAVARILSVRTVLVLIAASALGDYFFAGVRTFGLLFMEHRYGVGQATATTLMILIAGGAIGGVVVGGRVADRLLCDGWLPARPAVGAAGYLLAVGLFFAGFLNSSLVIALPLFVLAAAALAVPNPPLDAARLDVMHFRLWGRAEGTRTVVRTAMTAAAPLLFGLLADQFGGSGGADGTRAAFMIMLVPLALGGLTVLRAIRTYPPDVAAVNASEARSRRELLHVA